MRLSDLRSQARQLFERFPTVARSYRSLRETWTLALRNPVKTPLGFTLVGRPDMVSGEFEQDETALLSELLKTAEVFVDVGANIGLYACLAATRGVRTVAIEPLPENLAYLTTNLALNGVADVELFPLGVADKPGVLRLYGGDTGASLVPGWAGVSAAFHTTIAISTLDILLGARFAGKRVVVKIDVEGAEADALTGAAGLLAQSPAPAWLVEICMTEHHPSGRNPRFAETFERFWSLGYLAQVADGSRRPVERADVERWERAGAQDFGTHNFLFTK